MLSMDVFSMSYDGFFRWIRLFVLTAITMLLALAGCQPRQVISPPFSPVRVQHLEREPIVRVRILTREGTIMITGPRQVTVGPTHEGGTGTQSRIFSTPLSINREVGRFILRPQQGQVIGWALPCLVVQGVSAPEIAISGRTYPGAIWLHPHNENKRVEKNIDAVNHVKLETYLPGVLEGELFGDWHATTFAAQSIAARSYAITTLAQSRDRHYDLESTTASQVYTGHASNRRAITAVRQTRGQVLTYNKQVVRAYYSSCCGGTGQEAAVAFPAGPRIVPLQGREHGPWCKASKYFRWGPIHRDKTTLATRLTDWGQQNNNVIARLRGLRNIVIAARNRVGRPAAFTVIDARGRKFNMTAEQLRFAANHDGPGLPSVLAKKKLRSSHVQVKAIGRSLVFYDGRGFGHGVGMCQYGAQGLALKGYNVATILNFFYRDAAIRRFY